MQCYAIHLTNGFRVIIHSFCSLPAMERNARIMWGNQVEEVTECQ